MRPIVCRTCGSAKWYRLESRSSSHRQTLSWDGEHVIATEKMLGDEDVDDRWPWKCENDHRPSEEDDERLDVLADSEAFAT